MVLSPTREHALAGLFVVAGSVPAAKLNARAKAVVRDGLGSYAPKQLSLKPAGGKPGRTCIGLVLGRKARAALRPTDLAASWCGSPPAARWG